MANLNDIFSWFSIGRTPTADQFKQSWSSFWHKSEKVSMSAIFGLENSLNDKASKEDLVNATTNFKGYHTSLAALQAEYPQAKNKKDFFAWVGSPYPGTVYKVFVDGGVWTDTGEIPTQQEIDLAEYAKKEEVQKKADILKDNGSEVVYTDLTDKIIEVKTINNVVDKTNVGVINTNKYWLETDQQGNSTNWDCSGGIAIPVGVTVTYKGGLYGTTAGIIVKNAATDEIINFITADGDTFKDTITFIMPEGATHIKASWLKVNTYGMPLPFSVSWTEVNETIHVTTKEEFSKFNDVVETKLFKKGTGGNTTIYTDSDFTWVQGSYYKEDGTVGSSNNWKRATPAIPIVANSKCRLVGAWLGQTAGCKVMDEFDNVVQFIYSPNPGTAMSDVVYEIDFISHPKAKYFAPVCLVNAPVAGSNKLTFYENLETNDTYYVTPYTDFDIFLNFFIKNISSDYNYKGRAYIGSMKPLNPSFMDAYFVMDGGDLWGLTGVQNGDVLYWDGIAFQKRTYRLELESGTGGGGSGTIPTDTDYDVIIVGGGAGGIGAAYALKDTGLRVALIEKDNNLGGNHLNAWINVHATTPPPPFLKGVIDNLIQNNKAKYVDTDYQEFTPAQLAAIQWKNTYLRNQFTGLTEACISLDVDATADKYYTDLNSNVTLILGASVQTSIKDGKYIQSLTYEKRGEQFTISAMYYIDATGDNNLLQAVGGVRLQGEEGKTTFQGEYGFTESNAPINSSNVCNAPTLMYRCEPGTEDLSGVTASGTNDALGYFSPDQSKVYFNTVGYFGNTGLEVVQNGAEATRQAMIPKCLPHWKRIKTGGSSRFTVLDLPNKKFDIYAPKLGIRETYRAKCERLLHESDLYVKISSTNIKSGENLDKKIACGNHLADVHGTNNVNVSAINAARKPYGVPYGCIIPKGLNNLFVASRGAGLTHIGASSFRLNKDIMQLGWAAGHAAKMCINSNLDDTRSVNVEILQSSENTDFANTVSFLETIMI